MRPAKAKEQRFPAPPRLVRARIAWWRRWAGPESAPAAATIAHCEPAARVRESAAAISPEYQSLPARNLAGAGAAARFQLSSSSPLRTLDEFLTPSIQSRNCENAQPRPPHANCPLVQWYDS